MHLKSIHLKSIGSTNTYLSALIKEGKSTGELAVTADYQENGRGQGDHGWLSNPGENLLMSLLLFPAFLSASDQFHLSRVASLALCDTLKGVNLAPVIKWPNDILVNHRKIAGILIENGITGKYLSYAIIGIGLNLNQYQFPEFPVPATSLVKEGMAPLDSSRAADLLINAFGVRYSQLESGSGNLLEKEYLEHLSGLDQPGEFISEGEKFTGIIRGVNDFGELLVEKEGKIYNHAFHQIQCLVPGSSA